jgi:glycine dehydrogenase subunit 2
MSKLIFEKITRNDGDHITAPKKGFDLAKALPDQFLRKTKQLLPQASELEVVRHFMHLARKNFCVDINFYPLGSCTMKYNPKVFDEISTWPFYAKIHPYQDEATVQGMLEILEETEKTLSQITGMDAFTLQPAAGAHGELTGLLMVRAYHHYKKNKRTKVLIPDSAHGTNPASAVLCGYEVVQIKTHHDGRVDFNDLEKKVTEETACFMITNPSTLGLFEKDIKKISDLVHQKGGLVYFDGANLNALLGISRPGDMGFDIVHVNLHKTFAVPHGSGGPGSGPVGVKAELEKFLPLPRLKREEHLKWEYQRPHSIGRVRSFYGNSGAVLRAYCYMKSLGRKGLMEVSENAVLNANYLKACLAPDYEIPYPNHCMHEFILSASRQKKNKVKALDIAKRLLDFGIHAPTIYFPLIVDEAMMIEPTETESKETLDRFVGVMKQIAQEAKENPGKVLEAPTQTPVRRIDEVAAARRPQLRWESSRHEAMASSPLS